MTGKTSHGFLPNGLWRPGAFSSEALDGRREETNPEATRLADRFDCARHRWWSAPDGASIRAGADQRLKEMGRRCAWGRQHRPGTGDRGIRPLELLCWGRATPVARSFVIRDEDAPLEWCAPSSILV